MYLTKFLGISAHKFYGVLGSGGGGGGPKCLKILSWKMMAVSKNLKWKTPKKLQSSSHKWVLGEILQKLKGCLGKNLREFCLCVCVCVMGYTCHEKKVK